METELLDTTVTNLRDDDQMEIAAQHFKTGNVVAIMGHLANDLPVVVETPYFAAIDVERDLDEEEQATHGTDHVSFSSVLVCNEGGMVAQEAVVNVRGGDIDDAIEAFEMVVEGGEVLIPESSMREFESTDDGVVELEQIEEETEE